MEQKQQRKRMAGSWHPEVIDMGTYAWARDIGWHSAQKLLLDE